MTGTTTLIGFNTINLNDESVTQSTSAGGGVLLNVQYGSTFGGTISGFASNDAVAFDGVAYAPSDHAVFTGNGAGGAQSRSRMPAELRLRRSMSKEVISRRNSW